MSVYSQVQYWDPDARFWGTGKMRKDLAGAHQQLVDIKSRSEHNEKMYGFPPLLYAGWSSIIRALAYWLLSVRRV